MTDSIAMKMKKNLKADSILFDVNIFFDPQIDIFFF